MTRAMLILLWFVFGWVNSTWAIPTTTNEATTIAVWPFDSHLIGKDASPDEQMLLQEVVPDLLGAELSASKRLTLVERLRLGDILNEQKIGSSELADEATRLRLGRLAGVRWMVFGSYLRIGKVWQFDLRVVDVESTRIVATSSESGQQTDYVATMQRLAAKLLKALP